MKSWYRIGVRLAVLACLALAPWARADAVDALSARLAALGAFVAEFSQEVRGPQGQLVERATGEVRVLRPKFKWEVQAPYPQVIVADGEYLRVYDPDLAQVTLRPLEDALTDTPISLLTQEQVDLRAHFNVAVGEDGSHYTLIPAQDDSLYAEIRLVFDGERLAQLTIVDHLGQLTAIEFAPAAPGTVIQSGDFTLTLPPGTDVIGG